MPKSPVEGVGYTDRFSATLTDTEWQLSLTGFDWARITGVRAFGKPLTNLFATRLPARIDRRLQSLVVDVTAMPRGEEFRFWFVLTLDHDMNVRLPDNNAWLTRR